VHLRLAMKLSPEFNARPRLAVQLAKAAADGLVLSNRFYRPDIDLDSLHNSPHLQLSRSADAVLAKLVAGLLVAEIGTVHIRADPDNR
jgi:dihydroorotate dehydrogenase (fumarate)